MPVHTETEIWTVGNSEYAADRDYQGRILQGVSRTFALTIPQLPPDLRVVVGNAYLLCRIADTIEDSDVLSVEDKKCAYAEFISVVAGTGSAERFAESWCDRLLGKTLAAERDLVRNTARVVRLTRSFSARDRAALLRCVQIMSDGMEAFQEGQFTDGLQDLAHLDAYCYHVAGVVGEMLTELFCAHSAATAKRQEKLAPLAVSFGQGLQMTNILKDIWDDKERDVCWLPRGTFKQQGFDLEHLSRATGDKGFEAGLAGLVGVALSHLEDALEYTLLIPKSEDGIRRFCLWAIGMAVLTLRKINRNRGFRSGDQVKIARGSVKATIAVTRFCGWSNILLRAVFRLAARGLPRPETRPSGLETAN